ncbi:uncharacterized protein [Gossypium hirsutum]|uniref:Uncharacterized protein n=1 Tax=Gossypium hirsutum TaxID=3635 RepID=A0ABM3A6W5_GOSHI|nr:uncharacterized protein LOC121217944 [Gossypium hirsutum]
MKLHSWQYKAKKILEEAKAFSSENLKNVIGKLEKVEAKQVQRSLLLFVNCSGIYFAKLISQKPDGFMEVKFPLLMNILKTHGFQLEALEGWFLFVLWRQTPLFINFQIVSRILNYFTGHL